MLDGVEVGRVGWQEEQPTTRGLDQPLGGGRLVEPGVVQHDHAAGWQFGQQHLFKIDVDHLGVATALKDQRCDQFALLRGRDNAGAFPPFARHGLVNPLPFGGAARLTIQAVIHAAFVEVKDGLAVELFQFPSEEPSLHFVALAIFYEFFLA